MDGLSRKERKKVKKRMRQQLDRELKDSRRAAMEAERDLNRRERNNEKQASAISRELKQGNRERKNRTESIRKRRAGATDVLNAIGYERMFKNGLCEVEDGVFSMCIEFYDVSYQSARTEAQRAMLRSIGKLYNSMSSDIDLQFNLLNIPLPESEVGTRVWFDPDAQDSANAAHAAQELNEVLNDKMRQGVSNLKRSMLITFSTEAENADDAYRRLSQVKTAIMGCLEEIKCPSHALSGEEWLNILSSLLRPGQPSHFSYNRLSPWSGLTTKDCIAPMALDFAPGGENTYWKSDGTYLQALLIRDLESPASDTCISQLSDLSMPLNITWHARMIDKSDAVAQVRTQYAWVDKEIIDEQKKAVSKGYDYNILPAETKRSAEELASLYEELNGKAEENLFQMTGLIVTWADDLDTLTNQVVSIIQTAQASGIKAELLYFRQREAMNTALPLASNHIDYSRAFITSELCILVPFATQELDQEGGSWYYQNKLSGNLILGNRATLASPVGFVSGKTGSGKGFFVKNEITSTFLSKPRDQFIILDRSGEYRLLTEYLGGATASFGVDSDAHMNPLGMIGLENRSREGQIAFKADAILAQAAASAAESGAYFSDEERSIVQRCVENVLRSHTDGPEPVLTDLCNELMKQPEPQAQKIALRYERYTTGAMDFFNHPTNIDFDARIVDIDYKDVPETMTVFALINACETCRQQMYKNFSEGRRTWLYIEEMESLFRYPTVLDYFRRFSNECRKFGMYLTGITQSVDAMRKNEDAAAIVRNADFIVLLQQSAEDRAYWQKSLGLSNTEVGYIDEGTPRGDGLLIFGGAHVPFKGEFPKDTDIYRIFSTDPNEAEERSAREEMNRRQKKAATDDDSGDAETSEKAEVGENTEEIDMISQSRDASSPASVPDPQGESGQQPQPDIDPAYLADLDLDEPDSISNPYAASSYANAQNVAANVTANPYQTAYMPAQNGTGATGAARDAAHYAQQSDPATSGQIEFIERLYREGSIGDDTMNNLGPEPTYQQAQAVLNEYSQQQAANEAPRSPYASAPTQTPAYQAPQPNYGYQQQAYGANAWGLAHGYAPAQQQGPAFGGAAAVAPRFCSGCGYQLGPNDAFCPRCGRQVA